MIFEFHPSLEYLKYSNTKNTSEGEMKLCAELVNKITCPRCHSPNLYRFGIDKAGNQKISIVRNAGRQFYSG